MDQKNCTFLRRMGAIFYDSLLLFSVLLFVTIPVLIINSGEAIYSGNIFFQGYLILVTALYFILPWKLRGQTLGMQSWKIKVVSDSGESITYHQAIKRILFSCLSWIPAGLGFIWSIFDQENLAWHDRLSRTKLINYVIPKS
ncbi:MAG: RDD family protein [Gammaproteobacteria bacterium]